MIAWKLLLQGSGGSKPLPAGRPDLSFKASVVKRAKKKMKQRGGRQEGWGSSNAGLSGRLVVGIFGGEEPRPGPPPWGLGEAWRRRRVRGPGLLLRQRCLMTAKHTFLTKKKKKESSRWLEPTCRLCKTFVSSAAVHQDRLLLVMRGARWRKSKQAFPAETPSAHGFGDREPPMAASRGSAFLTRSTRRWAALP